MSDHQWEDVGGGYDRSWRKCKTCGIKRMTGFQPGWPPYYIYFDTRGREIPTEWWQDPKCSTVEDSNDHLVHQ